MIKLKDILKEFGTKELVKTIPHPQDKNLYAQISKAMTKYEINLGSYKGMNHYMINTTKEARTLPKAEKIAKEWLKSYAKNPK